MKIVTIGSCMSNNTANNLVLKYGLTHSLSVIHNRSDSLIDYFVENNLPQIPLLEMRLGSMLRKFYAINTLAT